MEKAKKESQAPKTRHSTTVYIPRKDNDLWVRALNALSRKVFGAQSSLGTNSRLIHSILIKTFVAHGLMSPQGEFVKDAIDQMEKDNVAEASRKIEV